MAPYTKSGKSGSNLDSKRATAQAKWNPDSQKYPLKMERMREKKKKTSNSM